MHTPFSPQLIGETEKTLNALLLRYLEGSELTEPQWVTLRIANMLDGTVAAEGLVIAVAHRAHFGNAARLVGDLTTRGLLEDGRLSTRGSELLTGLQDSLAHDTATVFGDLPADDVAATERVLNELMSRAREVLA